MEGMLLIVCIKKYPKKLIFGTDVIPIAEEFTDVLDSIGSKASNLPGGVRKLGNLYFNDWIV